MKKLLLTVIQIALLFIFARLINWVTALLHINIPGSIIGIVILFTLLHFNIIKLEWIEPWCSVASRGACFYFLSRLPSE